MKKQYSIIITTLLTAIFIFLARFCYLMSINLTCGDVNYSSNETVTQMVASSCVMPFMFIAVICVIQTLWFWTWQGL